MTTVLQVSDQLQYHYLTRAVKLYYDVHCTLGAKSLEDAVSMGIKICTLENYHAIQLSTAYPSAQFVILNTELETYQALRDGRCGLRLVSKNLWEVHRKVQLYNPKCDLEWVGRLVDPTEAGYAVKGDSGYLCSSLIRDVLNLHLTDIIAAGILGEPWESHNIRQQDMTCTGRLDSDSADRVDRFRGRNLRLSHSAMAVTPALSTTPRIQHRTLAVDSQSSTSGGSGSPSSALTVNQMLGTIAAATRYYKLFTKKHDGPVAMTRPSDVMDEGFSRSCRGAPEPSSRDQDHTNVTQADMTDHMKAILGMLQKMEGLELKPSSYLDGSMHDYNYILLLLQ